MPKSTRKKSATKKPAAKERGASPATPALSKVVRSPDAKRSAGTAHALSQLPSFSSIRREAIYRRRVAEHKSLASAGVEATTADLDAAKENAILSSMHSRLRELRPGVYADLGLEGTMDDDYQMSVEDFALFLHRVSTDLARYNPPFRFAADQAFLVEYHDDTGYGVAAGIYLQTTP